MTCQSFVAHAHKVLLGYFCKVALCVNIYKSVEFHFNEAKFFTIFCATSGMFTGDVCAAERNMSFAVPLSDFNMKSKS